MGLAFAIGALALIVTLVNALAGLAGCALAIVVGFGPEQRGDARRVWGEIRGDVAAWSARRRGANPR